MNKNSLTKVDVLTEEQFKAVLPNQVKKTINKELMDYINSALVNPEEYENYRSNLLSYTQVMKDGRFTIKQYVNAVRYVSNKLMGKTNIDSYIATFPDKYQGFLVQGVETKDIASYITAYNKSKLVNLILAQTMIPSYVLNQDLYQKALNVQADLMLNARSEKVRSDAANSILNQLKMPETTKVEIDVGVKQDKTIEALQESVLELTNRQRDLIKAGVMTAGEVAKTRIIKKDDVIDVGLNS